MRTLLARRLNLLVCLAGVASALLLAWAIAPASVSAADESAKKKEDKKEDKVAKVINPAGPLKAPKGFNVELHYTVPKEQEGSWVNMTTDPRGRLIVSDQYGALYRVTPQALGDKTGQSIIASLRPTVLDQHIYVFDISGAAEPLVKGVHILPHEIG